MSAEWLITILCNSRLLWILILRQYVEFNLSSFGTEKYNCDEYKRYIQFSTSTK